VKRQQFFEHRLQTLSALRDAVETMRSLAAHHFRRVRQALPETRKYREEMNTIVREIGIDQPLHAGVPVGLLVIASDLGLCGDYNSRIARLAVQDIGRYAVDSVYSVGRRSHRALAKHAIVPAGTYDAPASLEGLSRVLLGLTQDLMDDYLAGKIGGVSVVSAGFEGVGHFASLSTRVLPISPSGVAKRLRLSPYVDADDLTMVAIREYLYITLYEILLDALAAEHGMRLVASESALEWIDATTVKTVRRLAGARSESATQELLDIVAGSRKRLEKR
jgi:F-type H+-transporting ATPase subunit gamma